VDICVSNFSNGGERVPPPRKEHEKVTFHPRNFCIRRWSSHMWRAV